MTPDDALTAPRVNQLEQLAHSLSDMRDFCFDAETTEMLLLPLRGDDIERWKALADADGGDWVMVYGTDANGEQMMWAVDEATPRARQTPIDAVAFPELHSRLVAWWLVHAWRLADLAEETLDSLRSWRITVAAVTARALIEEVGCLLYEGRALTHAWAGAKATELKTANDRNRVREALHPILVKAGFGSRMLITPEHRKATNVLTYVQKLEKATENQNISKWYDLLTDAAHPAWGARIAMASQPARHVSGAVFLRFYRRTPVPVISDAEIGTDFTVAHAVADALVDCSTLGLSLLWRTMAVVDDFGLTTSSATLTARPYWRKLTPTRGARPCPCGRGKWSECQHWWGGRPPLLDLQ